VQSIIPPVYKKSMARIRIPDIITSSLKMHATKSCPRKSKLATFIFTSVDKCTKSFV